MLSRLSLSLLFVTLAAGLAVLVLPSTLPAQQTTVPPHVSGELLVRFTPETETTDRASLRSLYNATVRKTFASGAEHWRLHRSEDLDTVLGDLARNSSILYAERNWILEPYLDPNDPRYVQGLQWALKNTNQSLPTCSNGTNPSPCTVDADIDADEAWDIVTGSSTVEVAVIDTGIPINHPDFNQNICYNSPEVVNGLDDDIPPNGYIDDLNGYNFVDNNPDPNDSSIGQHGTSCASIVGARGNNGRNISGVAWSVKLMALKAANEFGLPIDKQIQAIDYAAAEGADIITHSYGGAGFSQAVTDAIRGAQDKEILFVTAAGNSDCDIDDPNKPSCFDNKYPQKYNNKNILVVASTNCQDNKGPASNWGATSIDLAAPGLQIYRLRSTPLFGYDDDICFSGTSAATPLVAGVAALIRAIKPSIPAESIKGLIMQKVEALAAGSGLGSGKTVTGGRLNARKAVENQDVTSPGTIANLSTSAPTRNTMNLAWTANGDDENLGTATFYDIRYSTSPITADNFTNATRTYNEPVPLVSGTSQSMTAASLPSGACNYWAMRGYDEWGNGPVSNVKKCGTVPAACQISYCKDVFGEMSRCTNTGQAAWTCPSSGCCQYNCVPDDTCTVPDPTPPHACGNYCQP